MVDGKLCIDLYMADPEIAWSKATKGVTPEHDKNGFRRLPNVLTSDSGAGDTVGPAEAYPEYPMEESPRSKRGLHYIEAGGAKIKNVGQKKSASHAARGQMKWIVVQIAAVKKTLASVSQSNDNGYDIVYSAGGSYIEDIVSGEVKNLRRERGVFVLDAWVVLFEQAKVGKVSVVDPSGRKITVNVGPNIIASRRKSRSRYSLITAKRRISSGWFDDQSPLKTETY